MNWEGSDCSAKSCPQGENGKSCSGRGTCDSGAGECACSEGYSGNACQRTLCPNDCSGKGTCDFTSGLCSCYGGFSGNDCSGRLCPRGDDPLTHEVENQGDGTVMQQAEVQEVTFSAGLGIGGSVTLTYTDLYGQSWTTRPISLGEGGHYVLDYAYGSGASGAKFLNLNYGGGSSVGTGSSTDSLATLTAGKVRAALLSLTKIKDTGRANLARSVHVTARPGLTSHKFTTGIEESTKKTFDIYITQHHTTGLDENGGLLAFTAGLGNADASTPATADINAGNAFVEIRSMSDASSAIKSALEALPNSVLPAVTVSKVDVTTGNTNDLGTNGNAYHQTYRITFSSAANSGDQNMLSCDAEPCDSDGCINRKVGATSVHYIHADPTFDDTTNDRKTPRINFQGKGYFIMDIHRTVIANPAANDFSSGTAYVEWNTGSGVDRAEFPIIADAATVETSLRTISGWSGVTVSCSSGGNACSSTNLDRAHSYTVTFPSGYDDGGQTPEVGLVAGYGGTADTDDDGVIIIYDQRFSNSLWLGDITGYEPVTCTASADNTLDFCDTASDTAQGEIDDKIELSLNQFGHTAFTIGTGAPLGQSGGSDVLSNTFTNVYVSGKDFGFADNTFQNTNTGPATFSAFVKVNHADDFALQTSQNTEHYFSVGSTIEVLESTWADSAPATRVPSGTDVVTNAYRSFKVLSHVKNTHGHMFAKLDSVPTTDSATQYALKVTSHNSTVTNRKNIEVTGRQQEIQAIQHTTSNVFVTGGTDSTNSYRIYINANKANVEFTEVLNGASTNLQIAEAINSFSALSGPVTVVKEAYFEIKVTFAAIDGDVPELSVVRESGSLVFSVHTLQEGWSFFAGHSARLENVQPGSVINITSSEKVTFGITTFATDAELVFSYDGHVGGTALSEGTFTAAAVVTAVTSIKDNKGATKVSIVAGDVAVTSTTGIVIKMPKGMDGSKLELLMAEGDGAAGITKSVEKNNNGRSFKVKRVENKVIALTTGATAAATSLTYATNNINAIVHDEIQFKRSAVGTKCNAIAATADVEYRSITAVTNHDGGGTTTAYTIATITDDLVGCSMNAYRTTIVVDSMPDTVDGFGTGVYGANVDMDIYGPKGTCSVSEAVKGTYESDVCSSRGNCDGASGLCVCHEGYSGEACETQTVLV